MNWKNSIVCFILGCTLLIFYLLSFIYPGIQNNIVFVVQVYILIMSCFWLMSSVVASTSNVFCKQLISSLWILLGVILIMLFVFQKISPLPLVIYAVSSIILSVLIAWIALCKLNCEVITKKLNLFLTVLC